MPAQQRSRTLQPLPWPTRLGLLAGLLSSLAALLILPTIARVPMGGILLHAGLVGGVVSLADLIHRRTRARANDAWIAACTPMLAIPLLTTTLFKPSAVSIWPAWTTYGLVAEAGLVAVALAAIGLGARRGPLGRLGPGPWQVATAGLLIVAVLVVLGLDRRPPPPGGLAIGAIAVAGTGVALGVQVLVAARLQGAWSALARAPGLIVAGVHLFDGLVAYLAVSDPLSLAPRGFTEQTPLSAFLLATVGLGYPLAKWGLGVAVTYLFDVRGPEDGHGDISRWGAYLFTILLGLYPGLFSVLHVLG